MQGWPEQPQGAPVLRDFDDPLDGHPRYEKIRWANPDKPNVQVALDRMRNRNVAVKFIERGYKITKHVRREILHHHSLLHENVIRFYDAFLTPNYLAIVMELGEMNLWQYVINRGGLLAEDEARDFFRQLIVGLDYCHSKGVANRDIKLENSILKTKYEGGKSTQIVKICDFGYCKSDYDSNATSLVGTSAYVAPEVIDATQKVYNAKAADIWSAGVVLYFMIEGRFPCGTEKTNGSIEALFKRICALELDHPEHMSTGPRELVAGIFRPSPNRVTIQQIMDHWWFKQDMPPHLKEQAVLVPEDGAPTEESLKAIIQQAELNEASLNTDRNIDELMVSLSHPLESLSSEVDKWFKDTPPQ